MSHSNESSENLLAGAELVKVYRAWNQIEKPNGIEIIDFDLAPPDLVFPNNPFKDRSQVIAMLAKLHDQILPQDDSGEFLKSRMKASLTFIDAIEGERLPLDEYLKKTIGVKSEIVPIEEIDEQRGVANELFTRLGYELTPDGWQKFFIKYKLLPEDIKSTFSSAQEKFVPIILDKLGVDYNLQYKTEFVVEDDYWINWISGNPEEFLFRINLHPRNQIRWYQGTTEGLAIHEMCGHLVQAYNFKENIKKGHINPGLGITMIPGPDQWNAEGMADTLAFLVPEIGDNLSPFGKFAVEYKYLSNLVHNNVHIWVNDDTFDQVEIGSFIRKYLPSETDERIAKTVDQRRNSPLHRAYLYTYNHGSRRHRQYAQELPDDKRQELVKYLYERPLTPKQIEKKVAQLKST